MTIWNNIDSKKPELNQRCIVWHSDEKKPRIAYYDGNDKFEYISAGEIVERSFTHWLVLPEPEEEK